jgi:hypothetical protein
MSYTTTPYPTITLTSAASSVTAANFKQSTLYRTIVPVTSSVAGVANNNSLLNVYPNPATNVVTIEWANVPGAGLVNVTITDVTGRVVLTDVADMNQLSGNRQVYIGGLQKGVYMLRVHGNGVNRVHQLNVE